MSDNYLPLSGIVVAKNTTPVTIFQTNWHQKNNINFLLHACINHPKPAYNNQPFNGHSLTYRIQFHLELNITKFKTLTNLNIVPH